MGGMWGAEQSFRRGRGCHACSWTPAGEHRLAGAGWCGTRCHLEFSLPRLGSQGSTASWVQEGGVNEVSYHCWHGATRKHKPCEVASLHQGALNLSALNLNTHIGGTFYNFRKWNLQFDWLWSPSWKLQRLYLSPLLCREIKHLRCLPH